MVVKNEIEEFPLTFAKQGDVLEVKSLNGGHHFKEMCLIQGIFPGQKMEIFSNIGGGSCLVVINESKVMIGHGMLRKIIVQKG